MVSQWSDMLPALQVFPRAEQLSWETLMALGMDLGLGLGRMCDKGHLVPGPLW